MLPFTSSGSADITLVLMPFLGGTQLEWRELTQLLAPDLRCITIDLPGFGAAADLPGYSVREMSDALIATLQHLGLRRYVLVGHSMAGKVAAVVTRRLLAAEAPVPAPTALILIAPSPPSPEPMPEAKREEMLTLFGPTSVTASDLRKDAAKYIDDNLAAGIPDAIFKRTVDELLRMDRAAWVAWLTSGSREDWSDFVGVLPLPALIVAGSHDAALGPDAQRKATLPHFSAGRLAILDSSHLIPLEQPSELAGLITSFLASLHLDAPATTPGQSLPVDYRALIGSPRVSPQTRAVLLARAEPDDPAYEPQSLSPDELTTLRSLMHRIIPQPAVSPQPIDLAARIDKQLATAQGDGWRYASLPSDAEACRLGLALLDGFARKLNAAPFHTLAPESQDALLDAIASGRLHSPKLDLQRWFEDLRADAVRIYIAHPQTLARMNYSGIADDPSGFTQIGIGQLEPWEPR